MKKIISGMIIGLVSAVFLLGPLDAAGKNRFKETNQTRTKMFKRLMKNVELTKAQREKIKVLRLAFVRDMVQLRTSTRLEQIELRELMNKTNPDINKVRIQAVAVSKIQGIMFERGVVLRAELKNVLTLEQKRSMHEIAPGNRNEPGDYRRHWQRDSRDNRNKRGIRGN